MASEEIIIKVKTDTKNADKGLDNIKKSAKGAGDEAKAAAGQFSVMGVSLNGVKAAFGKVIPMAKLMFTSIRVGLAATGIGAFVLAIGSLMTFFTKTKRGAEMLEKATAGLGAAFAVITDRMSALGEGLVNVFTNPQEAVENLWETIKTNLINRVEGMMMQFEALGTVIQGALDLDFDEIKKGMGEFGDATLQVATGMDEIQRKDFAESVKDIATEIKEETKAAIELKGALQAIKDEERAFSIEKAKTRQEIQKARLEAIDENKTLDERIEALQRAADLEIATTEAAIAMQDRKLKAKQAEVDLGESLAEDFDELAQLEVELIDLQTQSFQTRKRIATELETLTNEQIALDKQAAKDKIDADNEAAKNKKIKDKEELKNSEALAKSKIALAQGTLSLIQDTFGKESAAGKAAAIAQATINTYQGITAALASAPPPINIGLAAITGAAGFKSVADIVSTKEPQFARGGLVGGFGTGTSDSVSARLSKGETVINAKSTRMFKPLLSAMNEAGGGVGFADGGTLDTSSNGQTFGAIKAFVVTDDVTNSQNSLDKIRQKATI